MVLILGVEYFVGQGEQQIVFFPDVTGIELCDAAQVFDEIL